MCSGTTSKQIDRESHIRAVGYGGMLAESFVALIAMVTVMIVAQNDLTGLKTFVLVTTLYALVRLPIGFLILTMAESRRAGRPSGRRARRRVHGGKHL